MPFNSPISIHFNSAPTYSSSRNIKTILCSSQRCNGTGTPARSTFCQEISMLPCRPHGRTGDRSFRSQLSREVMAYIDVLRVQVGHGGFARAAQHPCYPRTPRTRCLRSRKHKTPTLLQKERSYIVSAIATYSASVVESVTHF